MPGSRSTSKRAVSRLQQVYELLADGKHHSLDDLRAVGGREATRRIRELRSPACGCLEIVVNKPWSLGHTGGIRWYSLNLDKIRMHPEIDRALRQGRYPYPDKLGSKNDNLVGIRFSQKDWALILAHLLRTPALEINESVRNLWAVRRDMIIGEIVDVLPDAMKNLTDPEDAKPDGLGADV